MDNEQKYKNTLEKVKELLDSAKNQGHIIVRVEDIETVFPELKESENERIRKKVIEVLKLNIKGAESQMQASRGVDRCFEIYACNKVIAWLEKQGEYKPYGQRKECEDCQFNYAGECKGYCQMKKDEQKPTDNVEPKFKVGDWVVYDHIPYQVVELPKEGYINLGLRRNGKVEFAPSTYCRHWTLQDAKDGDVLATSAGAFIYNGNNGGGGCPGSYCGINSLGDFQTGTESHWTSKKVYPATKEQCDLLFQNMAGEGYKWDADKKELLHKQS